VNSDAIKRVVAHIFNIAVCVLCVVIMEYTSTVSMTTLNKFNITLTPSCEIIIRGKLYIYMFVAICAIFTSMHMRITGKYANIYMIYGYVLVIMVALLTHAIFISMPFL
jgi:hypothetical protein